jgi:hypothetical protein
LLEDELVLDEGKIAKIDGALDEEWAIIHVKKSKATLIGLSSSRVVDAPFNLVEITRDPTSEEQKKISPYVEGPPVCTLIRYKNRNMIVVDVKKRSKKILIAGEDSGMSGTIQFFHSFEIIGRVSSDILKEWTWKKGRVGDLVSFRSIKIKQHPSSPLDEGHLHRIASFSSSQMVFFDEYGNRFSGRKDAPWALHKKIKEINEPCPKEIAFDSQDHREDIHPVLQAVLDPIKIPRPIIFQYVQPPIIDNSVYTRPVVHDGDIYKVIIPQVPLPLSWINERVINQMATHDSPMVFVHGYVPSKIVSQIRGTRALLDFFEKTDEKDSIEQELVLRILLDEYERYSQSQVNPESMEAEIELRAREIDYLSGGPIHISGNQAEGFIQILKDHLCNSRVFELQ